MRGRELGWEITAGRENEKMRGKEDARRTQREKREETKTSYSGLQSRRDSEEQGGKCAL